MRDRNHQSYVADVHCWDLGLKQIHGFGQRHGFDCEGLEYGSLAA